MASKTLNQRLVEEKPLRNIAAGIMLALFGLPLLGLALASALIVARHYGYSSEWEQPIFDFLQVPFTQSLASLGFVVTVIIPGVVGAVCYQIDGNAQSPALTDDLSSIGYWVLFLCLGGVVVAFVSLTIVTGSPGELKQLVASGDADAAHASTNIQALITATLAFYGIYLVQLMGFSPK